MKISQIVGISADCDQSGDGVSKNNESCNICIIWLKSVLARYKKTWESVYLWIIHKGSRRHNFANSWFICFETKYEETEK